MAQPTKPARFCDVRYRTNLSVSRGAFDYHDSFRYGRRRYRRRDDSCRRLCRRPIVRSRLTDWRRKGYPLDILRIDGFGSHYAGSWSRLEEPRHFCRRPDLPTCWNCVLWSLFYYLHSRNIEERINIDEVSRSSLIRLPHLARTTQMVYSIAGRVSQSADPKVSGFRSQSGHWTGDAKFVEVISVIRNSTRGQFGFEGELSPSPEQPWLPITSIFSP